MVKALFALAKYWTWWFIKPLVSRCCVVNLTRMMQTSSFNKTHVLVASNSISLSCLEGTIYINTIVCSHDFIKSIASFVALKILREIPSVTRSFMINTHPLVGCIENSDRKVKQFCVIPRITSSHLVYFSSMHWPKFCNVTPDLYRETVTQQTLR